MCRDWDHHDDFNNTPTAYVAILSPLKKPLSFNGDSKLLGSKCNTNQYNVLIQSMFCCLCVLCMSIQINLIESECHESFHPL